MQKVIFFILLLSSSFSALSQKEEPLVITIDAERKAQRIDNFGAAGAWFSEGIGKNWPGKYREQLAEWLFSKELDQSGNPKGIGLSSWRFNIGGGMAEQGDSSGITDFRKRVECFLKPDGTYDWAKQSSYMWFTRKAKDYGVENLIAFSNTPPVQFNRNGLGYKTDKDYVSNLKSDKYEAYAQFLATVLQHFEKEGLHFNYISPVNEPQWDWYHEYGTAKQEGSPWKNEEITRVVVALDNALSKTSSASKILITEAGQLDYLYTKMRPAGKQIQAFFEKDSPLQSMKLKHLPALIGGHSYFTDKGDSSRIAIRQHVADTSAKYGVEFWQTEYSMLADGYKEGKIGKIPAMDCALFLSKVIHDDLVYGNAAAWQLWNSWEPGPADFDTRYYVVALNPANKEFTDGSVTATKNLWAFGHYSRFVRPGMYRLVLFRNDKLTETEIAQDVMVTAYADENKIVIVAINYTSESRIFKPDIRNFKVENRFDEYRTTGDKDVNLMFTKGKNLPAGTTLPARSITTFVLHKK